MENIFSFLPFLVLIIVFSRVAELFKDYQRQKEEEEFENKKIDLNLRTADSEYDTDYSEYNNTQEYKSTQEYKNDQENNYQKENNYHKEDNTKNKNEKNRKHKSRKAKNKQKKSRENVIDKKGLFREGKEEEDLVRGILFKEILSKPRALRPHQAPYKKNSNN